MIAATTATAVVYLTGGNKGEGAAAKGGEPGLTDARRAGVISLMPSGLAKNCVKQPVQNIDAVETAVCVQPASGGTGFTPDRWEVSIYPSGRALREAFNAERRRYDLGTEWGKCNRLTWGEDAWSHGPGKPGGRRFCYFDGTTPSSSGSTSGWGSQRIGTCSR